MKTQARIELNQDPIKINLFKVRLYQIIVNSLTWFQSQFTQDDVPGALGPVVPGACDLPIWDLFVLSYDHLVSSSDPETAGGVT